MESPKATAAESTEAAAVEPAEATSVEPPKSAAEGRGTFGTNHETRGQSGTCHQHPVCIFPYDIRLNISILPTATWRQRLSRMEPFACPQAGPA